jgi:hypothetical protein
MPAALLAVLLPALIPVLADGVRGVVSYFSGGAGARPQNVDEAVKLMAAEAERLKALAALDAPATDASLWVKNLRASFRYIAAGFFVVQPYVLVLAKGSGMEIADEFIALSFEAATSAFSFIFGDRMYAGLKGLKK